MIPSIIFILLLILTHNSFSKYSVFFLSKHTVYYLISGFPNFITLTKNNSHILISKKFIIILNFKLLLFFSNKLKQLLPDSYQPTSINSLQERTEISTKDALYHLYTCANSTCNILPNNIKHT